MLRKVLIFCLALGVYSAPYYSLVETPTSRFEQKFLLSSPQLHEAYKIQPQQVKPHSEFRFPQHQQVLYYYPENSANHHVHNYHPANHQAAYHQAAEDHDQFSYKVIGENHAPIHFQPNVHYQPAVHYQTVPHQPLNLHQLRQETQFWQKAFVSPEPEKEEKEEEETDPTSLLEDTAARNSSVTKTESDSEESREIGSKDQFVDNSIAAESSEGTTTHESQFVDVRVDRTKSEDSDSVVIDSIERSAESSVESEESTEMKELLPEAESTESTTFEATSAPELESTTQTPLPLSDSKMKIPKATPALDRQEVYYPKHLQQMGESFQRFYVARGPPQFYGSIDPNALIFSIQQLQPVVRKTSLQAAEEEKITQFSMSPATEPSSALRIHVFDEDEAGEGSGSAPEQVSTRPISAQLPADDQSSVVLKQETSREDKREQSVIEGESTKIHSD